MGRQIARRRATTALRLGQALELQSRPRSLMAARAAVGDVPQPLRSPCVAAGSVRLLMTRVGSPATSEHAAVGRMVPTTGLSSS
jgi:hypothetical protein